MAKSKKQFKHLHIIKVTEYEGSKILIQLITKANLFQAMIYYKNEFYQLFEIIPVPEDQDAFTSEDLVKIGNLMITYAMQVTDSLIEKEIELLKPTKLKLNKAMKAD